MATSPASRTGTVRQVQDVRLSYALLYLPALLAWILTPAPVWSFGVAWAGSWWVLWVSMTGRVRPLPGDRSWEHQLFRPLFLSQVMFFGLFCFGSVFYMWSLASAGEMAQRIEEIYRTAAAQRYYLLGHAAFVHGILFFMGYRRSGEWAVEIRMPMSKLFLYAAGMSFALGYLMNMLPGLGQFSGKFQYLTVAAAILGTAYAIRDRNLSMVAIGSGIYGYMCVVALLSGWKSQIILLVGLLLIALYPYYKKSVLVVGTGAAIIFATLLPAYNGIVRQLYWQGGQSAEQAAQVAVERVISGEVNVREQSWSFLRNRLSKISLFTDYIQSTPSTRSYLGFSTTEQALYAMVPRVLWPEKPNTEELVMKRVYERTQSVRANSQVSAKPTVVVDGYVAAGGLGVWIACFLLGGFASVASRYAERWVGGYVIGGQLVYTGLFARVLFVPSFEFLLNALFWSFVLMGLLAFGLWLTGFLMWRPDQVPDPRSSLDASAPASNSPSMRV